MTSESEVIPLRAHRDSLERYLRGVDFSFDSVAGEIIAERLPARYAHAPLRPSLLLWACAANGGELADALPVAAAFDLFDRFMLLHDELGDDTAETIARWGLGQSLNAGDALYAVAFRSLASDVIAPGRRLRAARLVGEAVLAAIEERDGARQGSHALSGAALQAGALIGGAANEVAMTYQQAGRALGMAAGAADAGRAQGYADHAVALLQPLTAPEQLASFKEAAGYIARRAA